MATIIPYYLIYVKHIFNILVATIFCKVLHYLSICEILMTYTEGEHPFQDTIHYRYTNSKVQTSGNFILIRGIDVFLNKKATYINDSVDYSVYRRKDIPAPYNEGKA